MLDAGATGVGRYADTLLATLEQAGARPRVLAAEPAAGRLSWRWARAIGRGRRRAPASADGRVLRGPAELFQEAQVFFDLHGRPLPVATDAPPGIMHWTYPVPLRLEGWRNVYTVHDAIPLDQPALTPIDPRRHRRLLKAIARQAAGLVTVSQTARADVVAALGCDPALVRAAPQGVAPLPDRAANPAGLAAGGYHLFCGAVEPRKNLVRLVEAHAASGAARPLVIAGPDGWRAAEITARIAGRAGVIRLPYQTREALGALVRDARALLFPSLAEGFGLPVIEAMGLGVPVLTSCGGALEETAGGAALLADPRDAAGLAAAIARIDGDDGLRARLSEAGRRRAEAFSLGAYAERLAAIYAAVMGTVD